MQLNRMDQPAPIKRVIKRNWRAVFSVENLSKKDVTDLFKEIEWFCANHGGGAYGGFLPDYKDWAEAVEDARADLKWAEDGRDSGKPYQVKP